MSRKVLDFDRFLEERRQNRGFEFTVFGKTFYLPPTIPWSVMLQFERLSSRKPDEAVDNRVVIDLFRNVIGEANYTELTKSHEFDVDLMVEMLNKILELYGLNDPKQKKVTPPTE